MYMEYRVRTYVVCGKYVAFLATRRAYFTLALFLTRNIGEMTGGKLYVFRRRGEEAVSA